MIDTKRLTLRYIQMADLEDVFEYAKDEETGPRAGWPPHKSIEDTKKILTIWTAEECTEQVFGIVLKESNKVVGTIGYTYLNNHLKDKKNTCAVDLINKGNTVYEIGITLSKEYWNMGISTEALSAMLNFLFEKLNADVVLTLHYELNVASKRIQEKNNMKELFVYEKDKPWFNTSNSTMIVRGKTKTEWLEENHNTSKI